MERCYEKHTTLVRQIIQSVKDGVNAHTCTMKGCPGYLAGGNTRLDFKNESRHRPYSSAMLREALAEGPFSVYSLETMMM